MIATKLYVLANNFKQKLNKIVKFKLINKQTIFNISEQKQINITDITKNAENINLLYNSFTDEYYLQTSKENNGRIYDYTVYSLPDLQLINSSFISIAHEIIDHQNSIYVLLLKPKILLPCCNKLILLEFENKTDDDTYVSLHYLGITMIFSIHYYNISGSKSKYTLLSLTKTSKFALPVSIIDYLFILIGHNFYNTVLQPFTKVMLLQWELRKLLSEKILYNACL